MGKGPTSTTDYYNGITPPSGGYTIYLNKTSGGPSIYTASNDSQLISLSNTIAGQTFATAAAALAWFATQTDKMVFNADYPATVTNGLVLNLDAGFTPSYPTTGTTWYDLSSGGNNGALTNGPTFNSSNNGSIVFDGVDDYVSTNNSSSLTQAGNTQFTAELWAKKAGTDKDLLMGAQDQGTLKGWFLQWFSNSIVYFGIRDGGSNYNYYTLPYQNQWFNIVGVFDGSQPTDATKNKIYVNGVQQTLTTTTQLSSVPTNLAQLTIGTVVNYGNYTTANIAIAKIYNRALTAAEVLQNYNATKSRFGL